MMVWTVILKSPDGAMTFQEVEAEEMSPECGIPDFPDYVLVDADANEVARFPKANVLGIYRGRRTTFDVKVEPREKDEL